YRQAVSQSRWHRCQGAHPAAPRNVTITNVAGAQAAEIPVRLSLLGRRDGEEIELLVRFKTPALAGPPAPGPDTFWLQQGRAVGGVWLSDEYASYKAGKCYVTPQGPPLY